MTGVVAELEPVVVEIGGEELLTEFAAVMVEWGHYRTATGLRYPYYWEALQAQARWPDRGRDRRRADGTWIPIPEPCPPDIPRT